MNKPRRALCALLLVAAGLLPLTASAEFITFSQRETADMRFREPVLTLAPGPVRVVIKPGLCLDCDGYYRLPALGDLTGLYTTVIQSEFRSQLKNVLFDSGLMSGEGTRANWRATVERLSGESSLSHSEERRSPLTSGAVLTMTTVVRYELLSGQAVQGTWLVESRGSSGSTGRRWEEAIARALGRNIRKFVATLKQDLVRDLSPAEQAFIASIDQERDGTRSLVGNIVLGVVKTTSAVASAGTAVLTSEALASALDEQNRQMQAAQAQQRERELAIERSLLEKRQVRLQQERDTQAAKAAADRQAQETRRAREIAEREQQAANEGRVSQHGNAGRDDAREAEKQRQAVLAAEAEARRQQLEAEREAEARAREERLAEERAERERLAAERKAAEAAERQAKLEAEARASREYLAQIVSGTRLRARTCPGPGYYVVGIRPDIRPRTHSCVDVDFRASCRGSPNTSVRGTIRNFVGISTDCYMGDAVQIEKLACDAQDVVIETLAARECSFGN